MEQSLSWEANRFSASQEIPRILRNPKVHYRIHKSLPSVPILRQTNLFHAPISLPEDPFQYYHSNYARAFQVVLSVRFLHQQHLCTSSLTPYVLHAPLISFSSIWSPEEYLVTSRDH